MPHLLRSAGLVPPETEPNPNVNNVAPKKGLAGDHFTYTIDSKRKPRITAIATNNPVNGVTVTPKQLDGYVFGKAEWNKAPLSARDNPPQGWPAGKWPPKSLHELFKANERFQCLGQYCWGRPRYATCRTLDCGHTFKEWLSGGLDWTQRFELRQTGARGAGVFTKVPLSKREVIGCYVGRVIPSPPADDDGTSSAYVLDVPFGPQAASGNDQIAWVDAETFGNWTRFINHDCSFNCAFMPYRVGDQIVMVVETTRAVPAGAEVTVDYGRTYFTSRGMMCFCESAKCFSRKKNAAKGNTNAKGKVRSKGIVTTKGISKTNGSTKMKARSDMRENAGKQRKVAEGCKIRKSRK